MPSDPGTDERFDQNALDGAQLIAPAQVDLNGGNEPIESLGRVRAAIELISCQQLWSRGRASLIAMLRLGIDWPSNPGRIAIGRRVFGGIHGVAICAQIAGRGKGKLWG